MSHSSKSKVFLFGATGTLGAQILHFLTDQHYGNHFEVSVLVRGDTLQSKDSKKAATVAKLKSSGVHIVSGDAITADVTEIAKWISGHEIVISAISVHGPGPNVELKILEAVKLAKVPWIVPGIFGSDASKVSVNDINPIITNKRNLIEAVKNSGVNYFYILNYAFTEYIVTPFLGVDLANFTIKAPESFDIKISTTAIPDIGHLTVEALLHRNEAHVKNQAVHIVGDTLSFEEFAQILENHFKKPFKRVVISKEQTLAEVAADTSFQNLPARFRATFSEQKGIWIEKNESWNAQHAKNIKVTTVKEFVEGLKA